MKLQAQASAVSAKEKLDSWRAQDLAPGNPLAAENQALARVAASGGPYEVGDSAWWSVEVAHVLKRSVDKQIKQHLHPWLELTWVLEGTAELRVEDCDCAIPLAPGDAWLAPMHHPHSWKNTGEGPITLFGFMLDVGSAAASKTNLAAALRKAAKRKHYVLRSSSMMRTVEELRCEAAARNPGWRGVSQGLLHTLLGLLWRELNETERLPGTTAPASKYAADDVARIHAVHAFIHAHLAEPLTAEYIAAKNGVSLRHLNRLCRAHGFATVKQTLQRVRMDQVRQLLLGTSYSLRRIADLAGFSNADYLGQIFRKEEGMTPTEYRNTTLE